MNPFNIRVAIEAHLEKGWATLGLPIQSEMVNESKEGILDPEALIVATVLFASDARLLKDVVVWTTAHEGLLIHSKLAACVRSLSQNGLLALQLAKKKVELAALPPKVRQALGQSGGKTSKNLQRALKMAPMSVVSQRAKMVRNRLLFGASARADIITLLQLSERPANGAAMARLLKVNASTVSRVLTDLRDSAHLDKKGRFVLEPLNAPGLYLSTASPARLQSVIDAASVEDAGLRRAMLAELEEDPDGITSEVLKAF